MIDPKNMKSETLNSKTESKEDLGTIDFIFDDMSKLMIEADALKTIITEIEGTYKKEKKNLLLQFIEFLDAFERVFKNIESKDRDIDKQTKIWLGNFKAIKKVIEKALKQYGVVAIQTPDGKAIPGFHTIIETRPVENMVNDTILDELVKGYLWDSEILRKYKNQKLNEINYDDSEIIPKLLKTTGEDLVILRKSEVIAVKNE